MLKGGVEAVRSLSELQRILIPVFHAYGISKAVHRAAGMPVDVFDVSHIEKDSKIDCEIRSTGVTIYEK